MITGASNQNVPSPGLILPFFILSSLSLLGVTVLLLFASGSFQLHYFNPHLLGLTHIAAIGFITSIIFGSLFQMLPVMLEVPVYSEKLGKACFYTLLPGVILLCYSFWHFQLGLVCQIGASLLLLSFILFAINFYLSVRVCKNWSIEADLISTSIIWLLLTGLIGLLLVFNFSYVFIPISHVEVLKVHAHMGLVGWLLLLITGVCSRLFPMFFISKNTDKNKLKWSYYLCNAGLIFFAVIIFFKLPQDLVIFSAILVVAGIIAFLSYIYKAYNKRTRKIADTGLTLTLISFIVLIITLPFALIIPYDLIDPAYMATIRIIYGILALMGFAGILILGQTLKIIPFVLWIYKYQKFAGAKKIPLPKDLMSEKISIAVMYLFISGLLIFITGIALHIPLVIQVSALLLILSAVLFNINIFKAIVHTQNA